MHRLFTWFGVILALVLVASPAQAVQQFEYRYGGGGGHMLGGHTCAFAKVVMGKSLTYKCSDYGGAGNVENFDLASMRLGKSYYFVHPVYGIEINGPFSYKGQAPDKCEGPRYTGPDTSKPYGQQCTRVACVAGDTAGKFEEPIRYFTTSTGVTMQSFGAPGSSSQCFDGCIAKPGSNSGTCPSRVHSGDVSYQFCEQIYLDTATKCQHVSPAPTTTQPAYVPSVTPPVEPPAEPPPETCGVAGKPACPDPTKPPDSTCGGSGQPACYPGGTCGGYGQPVCTAGNGSGPDGTTLSPGGSVSPLAPTPEPTCGVAGKPACASDATCGAAGKPPCGSGDGTGSPGNAGSCGGYNQPACYIADEGMPTGAGVNGSLAPLEAENQKGLDSVEKITASSLGMFDWFPKVTTATCVNPKVPNPVTGSMTDVPICGSVNIFSKIISGVFCVLALFGMVHCVQSAIKA